MNKPLDWTADQQVIQERDHFDTKPYERGRNQTDNQTLLQDMLYCQQCILSNIFVTI